MENVDLLSRMRADLPPPDPTALARARLRLVAEMHSVASGTPIAAAATRRAAPRPRWQLAAVSGFALALCVGVAVAMTGAPSSDLSQGTTGAPDGSNAVQVLRLAAAAAKQAPLLDARPDQFVFIERVRINPAQGRNATADTVRNETWKSADGLSAGLERYGPEPLSPSTTVEVEVGCTDYVKANSTCVPEPAYRDDLPTSADAMLTYLRQQAAASGVLWDEFSIAGNLLSLSYVPPQSQAALFQALTLIPGITAKEGVKDALGRSGVGVTQLHAELIFDPETHAYLGRADERGQDANVRIAIVDRAGQRP